MKTLDTPRTRFALYFGNRGFFPASLISGARLEVAKAVTDAGYDYLMPPETMTRYGAVETREEGRAYAEWLADHRGGYDGVILSMPNFSDENGAVAALRDCGVPILLQAYPDEIGKMDSEHRRDSYCGKFSIADVFHQYRLPFTMLEPHVVHPASAAFRRNLDEFAAICRVAGGMRRVSIGCIGARTTAFKTVRFDEIALEKAGITVETFDLSDLFRRVRGMADDAPAVKRSREALAAFTDCGKVPADRMTSLAKVGAALDDYISEYRLDSVAVRCWTEMQAELGISPCVLLGALNERGLVASCEIDICSAVTMRALQLASNTSAACLDWNNNYGDDPDKVILFHCGPVAQTLMTGRGEVTDHKMFARTQPGCGWGSNEGRIAAFPTTLANCKTEDGKLSVYVTEGAFTDDPIEKAFFGCAGVCAIPDLQKKLIRLGQGGFRHHTTIGVGHLKTALTEAFVRYLGYDVVEID
jgi:L-fucose isomerase-like protein